MLIHWVTIERKTNYFENVCSCCKQKITDKTLKIITIAYVGWGRGDDDVYYLHHDCCKQNNGEKLLDYALRIKNLDTEL